MKKSSSLIKFLAVVIIAGIIGGVLSFILSFTEDYVITLFKQFETFLITNNTIIQITISGIFAIIILFLYFFSKVKIKGVNEETESGEILFDKIDNCLGFLVPFITVDMILSLTLFGFSVLGGFDSFITLGVFLVNIFFCILMTSLSINLTKKLYPERKGNPIDLNFNKEWLSSCDEAEKFVIYKSAYLCYQCMNIVYSVFLFILLLLGSSVSIGILPFGIIGFLWITQIIIYSIYAFKFLKGQIKDYI